MRIVFTLILLFPFYLFSQTSGLIVDNSTGKGVPYVNIWIENENIGTTSDFNGNFILKGELKGKNLILSAVGYEREKVEIVNNNLTIKLTPKIYEISEAVINKSENSNKIVIGEFDQSRIRHYYACADKPWIVAKLVQYETRFETTPFINKLTLLSLNEIKSSTFGLRFLSVDSSGAPGEEISNELILVKAKKGKKTITVDLSKYYLEIPKNGLFIAVEWLIIEENKYEFEMPMPNSKEKMKVIEYQPSIGNIPADTNEYSWIYLNGKWKKEIKLSGLPIVEYNGKYPQLAFELVLTN